MLQCCALVPATHVDFLQLVKYIFGIIWPAFEAFSSFHRNFRLLRSKSNLEIPHDISNIILIIFRTIDIITNKYCMYPR